MPRVLIVDDEYDIREGLSKFPEWEKAGFHVIGTAENGFSALNLYKKEQPELVLIDIKMPSMSGIELSKRLRAINPDVCMVILSGYNQFDYAKQAIEYGVMHYLLKPIDPAELMEVLEKVKKVIAKNEAILTLRYNRETKLKSFSFKRLIRGIATPNEVSQTLQAYGIEQEWQEYRIVIGIVNEDILSGDMRQDAIEDITVETLPENIPYIFFWLSENVFAILFYNNNRSPEGTKEQSEQELVCRIESTGASYISWGIGSTIGTIRELPILYAQAFLAALSVRLQRSDPASIFNKTYPCQIDNLQRWSGFYRSIQKGNEKDINAEWKQILIVFQKMDEKNAFLIINEIGLELAILLVEKYDFPDIGLLERIAECMVENKDVRPEKILNKLYAICREMIEFLQDMSTGSTRENVVKSVIKWIDQNYPQHISLKQIADEIYLHPFYLGKIFKEETGYSFNKYLNQLRIRKAKQLIETTDNTINSIASMVGYKHLDYFYKIFNKMESTTPGEYRKRFR